MAMFGNAICVFVISLLQIAIGNMMAAILVSCHLGVGISLKFSYVHQHPKRRATDRLYFFLISTIGFLVPKM